MNDFEQKLARQAFREPPAELRAEILRACAPVALAAWTWRDWLWPSPQAWAALAALWLVFAAVQLVDRPGPGAESMAVQIAPEDSSTATFLTLQTARDLRHVLELAN